MGKSNLKRRVMSTDENKRYSATMPHVLMRALRGCLEMITNYLKHGLHENEFNQLDKIFAKSLNSENCLYHTRMRNLANDKC